MENEDVIRKQMEETRTSLTEKLETLENKVVGTVQEATSMVSNTVEAVKETVQETVASVQSTVATVKDSVQDTVGTVTGTMKEGVTMVKDTVKDAFDIPGHVEHHPWLMFGSSVALGYCLGNFFAKEELDTAKMAEASATPPAPTGHAARAHHHGNGGVREKRRTETNKAPAAMGFLSEFAPEINKLKALALGAVLGTVREMVIQALPQKMGEQLKDIINSVTEKIGGASIPSSDWAGGQKKHSSSREESQSGFEQGGGHRQTTMGGFDR